MYLDDTDILIYDVFHLGSFSWNQKVKELILMSLYL